MPSHLAHKIDDIIIWRDFIQMMIFMTYQKAW